MDQNLQTFEGKVQTLGDKDLVEQVRNLFNREKRIGDAILIGLKEIKIRRLFAAMGYSSLFEMLVKHYHLSETARNKPGTEEQMMKATFAYFAKPTIYTV